MFLDELKVDLKDGVYKQNHVVTKPTAETVFENVKNKFIDAVLGNICNRYTIFV